MPVIDRAAKLAAIAAIRVDQPDVRIFHGGFAIGKTALCAEIDDGLAVRRPARIVFAGFGSRESMDAAVGKFNVKRS